MVGLVGEAAAARLFPRELLVEDYRLEPGRAELFGGKGACGTSAENGDTFHGFGFVLSTAGWPGGNVAAHGGAAPP